MAELIIRLLTDPETRKKNIIVSYRSDDDALPMEHEEDHRELVNRLIEGGLLKARDLGQVVVERVSSEQLPTEVAKEEAVDQRETVDQSS